MNELAKIFSIAIGGAFGAVSRYLMTILLADILKPFPFPTFIINISGSFLIGFLFVFLTEKYLAYENLRFVLIVGFLGAYTTFSSFELEIFGLLRENQNFYALLYVLASVIVGFIGVWIGFWLAKSIV